MLAIRFRFMFVASAVLADAFQAPSLSRSSRKTSSYLRSSNDDGTSTSIDSDKRIETNESLRSTIQKLVNIIDDDHDASKSCTENQPSIVHIIGTGLCPTLLNLPLSTLQILSQADVVLYDSLGLSYEDICQIVPTHCEVICVGKRGDKKSWKQSDIDELILQKSTPDTNTKQQGTKVKSVVRLKGGDPFLFGRARTEIETLRSNNIPYSYTPGISSCIAGPHLGGIPLTDPLLDCQSFGVWSGTDAFGKSWGLMEGGVGKEWQGLDVDVLVFLMIGRLDKLEGLCNSIANNGAGRSSDATKWNKNTPCAVIQNAGGGSGEDGSGQPIQRVWRSTLENIVPVIKKEDGPRTSVSPAVFIVGATASLDLLAQ